LTLEALDGGVIGDRRRSATDSNEKGERLMYDMANLKKLKTLGKGAPKAMDAFWAFDKAALADGVVPKKYKELIALGVALTTQCPYCLEIHRGNAVAAGATPEEIAETALVAAALRAGAAVTHATHLIANAVVADAGGESHG
jgi:AhpD family alkylhydroperoxidase